MSSSEGARTFRVTGDAYDRLMGRYSRRLAAPFADTAGVAEGHRVLDVGCGPGALTSELARRVGAGAVAAIDPSESFVAECARRNRGVDVRQGRAETLPFPDATFDRTLAQLVFHFVSEPTAAAAEMGRVLRPGGRAAACVWDFAAEMRLLRQFWDAARELDPTAPDEATRLRFGREDEIGAPFAEAGFREVTTGALVVEVNYESFDDLWTGFLSGVGPAGSYCASLTQERRQALRESLSRRLGDPQAPFALTARAWYAVAWA